MVILKHILESRYSVADKKKVLGGDGDSIFKLFEGGNFKKNLENPVLDSSPSAVHYSVSFNNQNLTMKF